MPAMISEIVAGLGMSKDRKWAAIEHQPLHDVAELVGRDRQLAASARVRTNGPEVKVADRHSEAGVRRRCQLLSERNFLRIEVDVRVEIADRGFGHWRTIAPFGRTPHLLFQV